MHPFKDPIAVKKRMSSKTFAAPTKEQATTGRFMQAGDNYGVGHRTPVGKTTCSGPASGPIPQKSKCFSPEELFHG